jgi:hypothetical protein
MEIQVIAEQRVIVGIYEHVDTQYFTDSKSAENWLSGVVEWADRIRIFTDKSTQVFFEGVIINKLISKWEKKDLKGTVLDTIV